jgi:hypothetical protein
MVACPYFYKFVTSVFCSILVSLSICSNIYTVLFSWRENTVLSLHFSHKEEIERLRSGLDFGQFTLR